jgi:hypothetical protein
MIAMSMGIQLAVLEDVPTASRIGDDRPSEVAVSSVFVESLLVYQTEQIGE